MAKITKNELENYKRETFFRKAMCYINKAMKVNFKTTLDKQWRWETAGNGLRQCPVAGCGDVGGEPYTPNWLLYSMNM